MDEPARKRRKTSSPAPSSPTGQPAERPSFAPPIKASLGRNYSNLPPPQSPARDQLRALGKQARAFVLGEADVQQGHSRDVREKLEDEQATTPSRQNTNGTRRRDEAEPDLPLTPSQRGTNGQDAPRGILFSSPSKKPPRAKGLTKQSPLQSKTSAVKQPHLAQPVEIEHDGSQDATGKKGQPPDPEIERRKQEKARLEHELRELEAQVSRCTQEIAKEQQREVGAILTHSERIDMIDFISKLAGAETPEKQPAPISTLLNSFLPFSSLVVPPPSHEIEEKPVPSHRPLELADPLPYLSMFTSFTFSTQLSLPRSKISPSSTRVHQKHTIDIVGPQKLLTAQLSATVDAVANQVVDMAILRLSSWADGELGAFLRLRAHENDISNACWAIDSFWTLARTRAQYWHKCTSTFAHLLPGRTTADTENTPSTTTPKSTLARRDLTRHLGRDVLVLQDKDVLLKLNWRIDFDWTGEAESSISVEHAVPRAWTEVDSTGSFAKVPDVFASLLDSRGVFEATRILVAMLFARP